MAPLPAEKRYTYADLLEWDDPVRYELYDGYPEALASPAFSHQLISGELFRQLANHLVGKRCNVASAPCDVRLFEKQGDQPEDVDTVVQPDLLVVCDPKKTDRRGVHGAPDLVVEVLSESTRRNDLWTKHSLYQQAGVREYWIVDPKSQSVSVYVLEEDGTYHAPAVYGREEGLPVTVLEGCTIDLSAVFSQI